MGKVKRNLRPLLRFLSLQGTAANDRLLETLDVMAEAFERGEPLPALTVSTALIPARLKRYLLEPPGAMVRDRYEFMVYRQLRDGLEAGDLHCRDSARFRSFDDDLVDDETFERRAELFPRHGLENAARPLREQLEELQEMVEERFESVNRRILAGENRFVRVQDGKTIWERAVRSEETVPGEPCSISSLGHGRAPRHRHAAVVRRPAHWRPIDGIGSAFEHVLGRYRKSSPSKPAIIASLMAYATNIGLGRMADICNLSYQELSTTAGNYIRLETLKEANDRLANATARLPIFRHFDIDEVVHSSSDGQKFEAAIPTINARHSSKYFGLNKGVVSYTLLANHVPLNARIIGAPIPRLGAREPLRLRYPVQQRHRYPAGGPLHRHPRHQPRQLRLAASVRVPIRPALPQRPTPGEGRTARVPPSDALRQELADQAEPPCPRGPDPLGGGQHRADSALSGAQEHNPERDRREVERLSAQEPFEASAVGARRHHPHPVPARLHRLAGAAAQRPEGAQPRRGLPPAAPCHRLRARRSVPGPVPA
jgi:hypothetical protein